jgi:hypothetical protein
MDVLMKKYSKDNEFDVRPLQQHATADDRSKHIGAWMSPSRER